MAMNKNQIFLVLFSFLFTLGCKSLMNPAESESISPISLDELSTPRKVEPQNLLGSLAVEASKQAENLIKQKENNLASYYQNYLDSLKQALADSGKVQIKGYEDFLIDLLSETTANDTIYLANLVTESNSKDVPLTFQYTALKNDKFFFEIECLKSNSLSELIYDGVDIQFIEGSETRYEYSDLKKKDKIKGVFKVLEDNPVVLNINKKGFSRATLRVKVKKILGSNLIVEKLLDSIEETKMVVREVTDTVYHLIDDKQYFLSAQLDFSNSHEIIMPVIIKDLENVIGWAYWIGLDDDINQYEELTKITFEDPLKLFAKTELLKLASEFHLPKVLSDNIDVNFSNSTRDYKSLNSNEFYSFFKSDSLSEPNKGRFDIVNVSKLYDLNVAVKVIAVNKELYKIEEEETTYKYNEYINISLLK